MDELIAKLNELYARPLSGDPLDNGWYEGERYPCRGHHWIGNEAAPRERGRQHSP